MLRLDWMKMSLLFAGAGIALAALATVLWLVNGWDAMLAIMYLIADALITGVLAARLTRQPQPTGPFADLLIPAHAHADPNQQELLRSDRAGCFSCLSIFKPKEEKIDFVGSEPDGMALCPRCGIDSVIGSASGYPITHEFMQAMNRYWMVYHNKLIRDVVLIAGVCAAVALVVLAILSLHLPWGRIFLGLMGLGSLAVGVEAIVKQEITGHDPQAWSNPYETYEGLSAVVIGLICIGGGILLLLLAVLAPWE